MGVSGGKDRPGAGADAATDSAAAVARALARTAPAIRLLPITSAETLGACRTAATDARTVFVASYPKSGTTWMQSIVYHIVTRAARPLDHISNYTPIYDFDRQWSHAADGGPSRFVGPAVERHAELGWRMYNTHLLLDMLPATPCRIVYVTRDARDTCVSCWHHFSHMAVEEGGFGGDFDEFVDWWCEGNVYGRWPDHIRAWVPTGRRDPRVLITSFEALKRDLPGEVRRVADHIGAALTDAELAAVCGEVGFAAMKRDEAKYAPTSVRWRADRGDFSFVRRGASGDGKQEFAARHEASFRAMMRDAWGDEYEAVAAEWGV